MTYILFVLGIALLIKGADWLVDGSSALAKEIGIPSLIIGLTVVAFGTSMPELVISIVAVAGDQASTALGNIVGSNIANILLVLGIAGLIAAPKIRHSVIWKEVPFSLLGAVVLFIVANDRVIDNIDISILTRVDGLVLLSFFLVFLYYLFEISRRNRGHNKDKNLKIKKMTHGRMALLIVAGVAGLWIGGDWVVNGAVLIASSLGLSDFLVAATIVAVGTSLPELVTAVRAAMKDDLDLAVGNVVGSNVFNIFWILGITSLVGPIDIPGAINFDILFLVAITLLFFLFMFAGKRHTLTRTNAATFLVLYGAYLAFIILRG